MYVLTKYGLVSIVENKDNSNKVMIRARTKNAIGNFCPKSIHSKIKHRKNADYEYGISLSKQAAGVLLTSMLHEIDYTNFKQELENDRTGIRTLAYKIWSLGVELWGSDMWSRYYHYLREQE